MLFDNKTRILAIGDWHGFYDKVVTALENAQFSDTDLLIGLGDYLDRGDNCKKCMQLVIDLFNKKDNVKLLLGNHDQMLLETVNVCSFQYLNEDGTFPDDKWYDLIKDLKIPSANTYLWLLNGGDITMQDINYHSPEDRQLFKEYVNVLKQLDYCFHFKIKGQDYICAHAGINPKKDFDKNTVDDFIWIRDEFFAYYQGQPIVIIGHTPTQYIFNDNKPQFTSNIYFCDTGSYWPEGKVSVVDVLTRQYWQG